MEKCSPIVSFLLVELLLLQLLIQSSNSQLLPIVDDVLGRHGTQVYIIDVERQEQHDLLSDGDLESFHRSFLPNSTLDSGQPRLVYSYRHVLSGFAAHLTPGELEVVKSKPGFLYAQCDRRYQLATTYTPKYLGLTTYNAWGSSMMGQGLIIGVIDTGIKPRHPSFKDTNMPPKPPITKWKGNCSYTGFPCNNKIIGAKAFYGGTHPSPEDTDGHGTHVASTAAGNFVKDANVLGMAKGDPASGMAPMAHLSIYKVCYQKVGCDGADTYAAIDQAIKDGVDIISMSISGYHNATLYEDSISRGSMAAIQYGIIPVAAAGNDGPKTGTLCHSAPWVLTVGASTTDRRISSIVELGDGRTFLGESAYQPSNWNSNTKWQLEYPGKNGDINARCCVPSELANWNLRGKIVICEACLVKDEEKGKAAYLAGADGMIVLNQPAQGHTTSSPAHILPASNIGHPARVEILDYYFNNQPYAFASIHFQGTKFGFIPSPAVASFSSRGPSRMNGGIIKPDVLAPGVNILAAWPRDVGPNPNPLATHTFNFESGTSMATPHVSGIVALVRSKHRGWTPAEIISAIVTTAVDSWSNSGDLIVDDNSYKTAGIYATGAGQVNPTRAMDPGLVFGLTLNDYIGYLCGLGYNDQEKSRSKFRQFLFRRCIVIIISFINGKKKTDGNSDPFPSHILGCLYLPYFSIITEDFHLCLSWPLSQMEQCSSPIVLLLLIELLLLQLLIQTSNSQLLPTVDDVLGRHGTQVYIIDVEKHEQHDLLNHGDLESFHRSFLSNSILNSGKPWLVYSYHHVLSGYAARLTSGELEVVKSKPGFLYE
ncbi:subtilisin-like protease SBT1.2 [Dendrobium catenatum]|uniref:Subtilisin-like protease SDD1 n=1 Tax=Dendrobium catenatum TaxID=906689 RepID=A0A2I0VJP3_9ASPA|nr:subtilisin-like protease SBT1.2 [Dendrobium catenatum]PKU63630.1 Subtilisin-like protease SDD1 [Dendrobium catenatum]